jgi:5-methylcytosine-specific restriction protein A
MAEKAFDIIFQEYIPTSIEIVAGHERRRRVSREKETNSDREIRLTLPALLKTEIEKSGRTVEDYRVYGSVGQINWFVAKIPWVAALNHKVTSSTEHGYYIVLLFREDMNGCVLSLNQGFTQYQRVFGTNSLATKMVNEGARLALSHLEVPPEFIQGPIDLGASGALGIGYEQGAIVSKSYTRGEGIASEHLSGKRHFAGRDRDQAHTKNPTNMGQFASIQEISVSTRVRDGPGRGATNEINQYDVERCDHQRVH